MPPENNNPSTPQEPPVTQPAIKPDTPGSTPNPYDQNPVASPLNPTYPPVSPVPPKKSGPSGLVRFLIITVVILVLVGAGVAAALFFMQDDTTSNDAIRSAEQSTSVTGEGDAEKTVGTGGDTVSTLCFSFDLPTPHQEITTENDCILGNYYYGADDVAAISVSPFANNTTSLDAMIAFWKKNNASLTTIQKEEKFKLGAYDAVKIVHKAGTNGNTTQTVLVFTDNKYKLQNVTFEGFEIIGLYSDDNDSKKGYDSILASWQWK